MSSNSPSACPSPVLGECLGDICPRWADCLAENFPPDPPSDKKGARRLSAPSQESWQARAARIQSQVVGNAPEGTEIRTRTSADGGTYLELIFRGK